MKTDEICKDFTVISKWRKSNSLIWHTSSENEVMKYSPIIADMLALNTESFTIEEIT